MAGNKKTKVQADDAKVAAEGCKMEVPTFTLRADQQGHLQALIVLRDTSPEIEQVIRQFELYMGAEG